MMEKVGQVWGWADGEMGERGERGEMGGKRSEKVWIGWFRPHCREIAYTCFPVRCGAGARVMNHWDPLVSGPRLAMTKRLRRQRDLSAGGRGFTRQSISTLRPRTTQPPPFHSRSRTPRLRRCSASDTRCGPPSVIRFSIPISQLQIPALITAPTQSKQTTHPSLFTSVPSPCNLSSLNTPP